MIIEFQINAAAYLSWRSYHDDKPILKTTSYSTWSRLSQVWGEPSAFSDRGAIPHPLNQSLRTGCPISADRQA
jgi:hypothetical protein